MKIVAHRGYSQKYPENTLLAFSEAIKLGADGIELDVHHSLDNKLMVHHDYGLGHREGVEGYISEQPSSYLKAVDVGSWFDPKFSNLRMPYLEEVFETLKDTTEYEIELKGFTRDFMKSVMDAVTR